ncbi:MAG: hypothetical protein K2Y01_02600 [Rhabdochlamydiaceae bacterium]|nr:hypothetical protein [Rhabdochlamydiaceae bacterium]
MNKLLWLVLLPFFAGCSQQKTDAKPNSDNVETPEYYDEPEGYGGGNDSTE